MGLQQRLEVGKGERERGKGLVFSLSPVGELVEPLTCIPFPTRVQKALLQEVY